MNKLKKLSLLSLLFSTFLFIAMRQNIIAKPAEWVEWIRGLDGLGFTTSSRLIVGPSKVVLDEKTYWAADEVVITGPVVTTGENLLVIETRNLRFEENGVIKSFENSASPGDLIVDVPSAPTTEGLSNEVEYVVGTRTQKRQKFVTLPSGDMKTEWADVEVEIKEKRGETGKTGTDGTKGNPGTPGMKKEKLAEIMIFAGNIEGRLRIEAKGQQGGPGGSGGRGGPGGRGAQGRAAEGGDFFDAGSRSARQGGKGGTGGVGGVGGVGGDGGPGLDVFVFTSKAFDEKSMSVVVTGGLPGIEGKGGQGGDAGEPGAGGLPAVGKPIIGSNKGAGQTGEEGIEGPDGPAGSLGKNHGKSGQFEFIQLNELELSRQNAIQNWVRYHLVRNFWLLTVETLSLIDDEIFQRERLKTIKASLSVETKTLKSLNLKPLDDATVLLSAWTFFERLLNENKERLILEESTSEISNEIIGATGSMIDFLSEVLHEEGLTEESLKRAQSRLTSLSDFKIKQFSHVIEEVVSSCAVLLNQHSKYYRSYLAAHDLLTNRDISLSYKKQYEDMIILNAYYQVPACLMDVNELVDNPYGVAIRLNALIKPRVPKEMKDLFKFETPDMPDHLRGPLNIQNSFKARLFNMLFPPIFAEEEPDEEIELIFRENKITSFDDLPQPIIQLLEFGPGNFGSKEALIHLHPIPHKKVTHDDLHLFLAAEASWLRQLTKDKKNNEK